MVCDLFGYITLISTAATRCSAAIYQGVWQEMMIGGYSAVGRYLQHHHKAGEDKEGEFAMYICADDSLNSVAT